MIESGTDSDVTFASRDLLVYFARKLYSKQEASNHVVSFARQF